MPLTEVQQTILALLAQTRAPDSYLAGGAALHFTPNSVRYSNDLDFFHDSPQRVASAFSDDAALLEGAGFGLDVDPRIRACTHRGGLGWAATSNADVRSTSGLGLTFCMVRFSEIW